jgi:hypothetical protein
MPPRRGSLGESFVSLTELNQILNDDDEAATNDKTSVLIMTCLTLKQHKFVL